MYQGFIGYSNHDDYELAALVQYVCPYCRHTSNGAINVWDLPRAPPARLFVISSQLSGSNGEWTNADDLASKSGGGHPGGKSGVDAGLRQMSNATKFDNPQQAADAYRARQRRQNQKNPGSGGKGSKNNNWDNASTASSTASSAGSCAPAHKPVKSTKKTYVTHIRYPFLAYDGESFFRIDPHETTIGIVPVNCVKSNVGYFLVDLEDDVETSKNKEEKTIPPFGDVRIPGYRRVDVSGKWMDMPESNYVVVEPLWRMYLKSYRTPVVSDNIAKAVFAHAVGFNNFKGIRPECFAQACENTALAFLGKLHQMESTRLSATYVRTIVTNNFQTIGVDDGVTYRNMSRSYPGLHDFYEPIREMNVDAVIPLNYLVRGDFEVECYGGVTLDDDGRPVFPEGMVEIRRYRTVFFRLSGQGQAEWCEHAPTSYNLNRALKRMLGGKANEESDRATAIAMGTLLRDLLMPEEGETNHVQGADLMYDRLLNGREVDDTLAHHIDPQNCVIMVRLLNDLLGMGNLWGRRLARTWNTSWIDPTRTAANWVYAKVWEAQATYLAPILNRELCSEIVHTKAPLRQSYVQGKRYSDPSDIYVKLLEAKMKREIAKGGEPPKPARITVGYQEGCMYANELPEYVKCGISGAHRIQLAPDLWANIFIVAKPKEHPLSKRFKTMIDVISIPGECCALIYSDDFCLSGCYRGQSFAGNGDISSNDSSQDIPAFLLTWYCLAAIHPEHARGLIEQCMLPIRVVSPECGTDKLDIKFKGPFEGSGTVLTTILNHLGTTLGCICALRQFVADVNAAPELNGEGDGVDFSQSLSAGFRQVGHTVTWQDCCSGGQFIPERLQFLKHSPCRSSTGEWISVLNTGAMLRSLGSVQDDLLPRSLCVDSKTFSTMTNEERISMFTGAVVAGHVHEPSSPILDALRARFPSQGINQELLGKTLEFRKGSASSEFDNTHDSGEIVDVTSWMRRYDLTEYEVDEMVAAISQLRVGHHYRCTGFAKIYAVDYDMAFIE